MGMDGWDDYLGGSSFLKAINVNSENDSFQISKIEEVSDMKDEDIKRPRLTLDKDGKSYIFDLNVTNAKKMKELGVVNPNALVGKKIYFKKALVRNPQTNQEVDGLRIYKVE
jgi:hypothetical protein